MALSAEQRQQYGEHYIKQAFSELVGREPTPQEIAQFFPSMGTNPNIHDTATMRAQVASYAQQEKERTRPERERQEAEAKATEHFGTVDSMFTNTLGRAATDAEKKHFGRLFATKEADEYTLQNFLENLPDYRQKKDDEFRSQQRGEFEKSDTEYYNEKLLPAIQQQFARQGRSLESSGFASALAQAAKQQSGEREKYLTNLSSQQYLGRTGAARDDYKDYMNRLYATQDYGTGRRDQLFDAGTARQNELENFYLQRSAYEDYLRRYGKRKSSGLGGMIGGLVGGGIGAYFGGVPGAGVGHQMGSTAGNMFGGNY